MPEEEVGWIKIARRILGQYRGVIIDDILEWKQILLVFYELEPNTQSVISLANISGNFRNADTFNVSLKMKIQNSLFKWRIGNYLWMIIAIGIFHLKLLYAITYPLHSFCTKQFKTTIYFNGEKRQPYFSLFKVAMVFLALSLIWHCFAWPNPMSALQWNFSILPQSLVANSHSAPQIISTSCSDQMEIKSQSETVQCKMNGKVNLGVGIRLKNIIMDSILTVYETIIDSLSLASEFISNMFG